MTRTPDFLIIGAMKSATSSLYDQLVQQSGIFMSTPKEPNFFSDDTVYAHGFNWYENLFKDAKENDLVGEASTHYTKLPTYPNTVLRIKQYIDKPRLIYVMRHPIDRLVSHYIHEWSQGIIKCGIDKALDRHPELIAYSMYSMQLKPYIEAFGLNSILPVFFDRIKNNPDDELARICNFIGYQGTPTWHFDMSPSNVSLQRVRKFPLYSLLVESRPATWIRRRFVPKSLRDQIRHQLSFKKRPVLSEDSNAKLQRILDDDLAILAGWMGIDSLTCKNFVRVTSSPNLEWSQD